MNVVELLDQTIKYVFNSVLIYLSIPIGTALILFWHMVFFLQFSFHSYKIGALILFWHTRFCNSSPDRHKVSKQQSLRINAKNAQQFLHCLLWDHLPREMSELMPFTAVAPRNASISIPPPTLDFKPRSRRSLKAFLLIKNTKCCLTLNYRFITLTRETHQSNIMILILFPAKTKNCACKMTFPFNDHTIFIQRVSIRVKDHAQIQYQFWKTKFLPNFLANSNYN